jgi:hypothetical protein
MDESNPDLRTEITLFSTNIGLAAGFNCVYWPCTEHEYHVAFQIVSAAIILKYWPYYGPSDFEYEN